MRKILLPILAALAFLGTPTIAEAQPDPSLNRYLLKNRGRARGPIRLMPYAAGNEPTVSGGGWIIYDNTNAAATVWNGAAWVNLGAGGGAPSFDTITTGQNLIATMTCGTGCAIAPAGTGVVIATTLMSTGLNTIELAVDAVGLTIEASAGQTAHLLDFDASGGATTFAYVLSQGSAHFPQVNAGDAHEFAATIGGVTIPAYLSVSDDTTTPQLDVLIQRHTGAVAATSPILQFLKSRGTAAASTVVVTGDRIGQISAGAYDGTDYVESAAILFEAVGTIGNNRVPTQQRFFTGTDAAPSVSTLAMTIDEAQVVTFANPPVGLGVAWASAGGATTLNTATDNVGVGAAPGTVKLLVSEDAAAAGTPNIMTLTGASHTGLTATTEVIGVYFDLSATKTWDTGAITLQREMFVQPPTYAAAAASVITDAFTMDIGRPIAGANVTLTRTHALRVAGISSPMGGANSEAFGLGATIASSASTVVFGDGATSGTGTSNVVIGQGADALGNCQQSTIIGAAASVGNNGGQSTVIGYASSVNLGTGNIVIGRSSVAGNYSDVVILADGLTADGQGQVMFGNAAANDFYFGGGPTIGAVNNGEKNFYIKGKVGTNQGGANWNWYASDGTGQGDPGDMFWYTYQKTATGAGAQSSQLRGSLTPETWKFNNVANNATNHVHATTAEVNGVLFDLNQTKSWATGAIATQREALFQAPTYAFAGASVVTDAATVAIDGAPIAGANATLTTTYALWAQAGLSRFGDAILMDETTEPTIPLTVGALYTTTSNDLRFKGGDGVDNQVTLHNGAKYYFNAVGTALDLTEANIDHGIDAATTEHMDGTWAFKAGTNGATGGFTITDVANNGGAIRCTTSAAHGITAPSVVVITNTSDGVDLPNGIYYVDNVSDGTHFDLLGSTFTDTTATADYIEPSQLTAGASDAGQYDIEWDLNQVASGAGSTYITKSWKCTSAGVCAAYASGIRERTTTTTTIGHYYGKSIESAVASGDKFFLTTQAGATNVDPTNKYGSLSTRRH